MYGIGALCLVLSGLRGAAVSQGNGVVHKYYSSTSIPALLLAELNTIHYKSVSYTHLTLPTIDDV